MSLCGVGVLIYFIHHIATSIQASNIIASVAAETNAAIDRLLPDKMAIQPIDSSGSSCINESHETNEAPDSDHHQLLVSLAARSWYPVLAAKSGYVQSINNDALLRLAAEHQTIVRVVHGIGTFVVQDTALLSLAMSYPPTQHMVNALNATYSISRHRTVDQDPAFGIRQIVDMAMKALSPGVNDTSTAVMCVAYLSSIMARLAGRQFPPSYLFEHETLRLVVIVPKFSSLLAEAFDQIRSNAEHNMAILVRMLGSLNTIASLTSRLSDLRAIDEQLHLITELTERNVKSSYDRSRLEKRLLQVRTTITAQTALYTVQQLSVAKRAQQGSGHSKAVIVKRS
jgi:uncharacterized membrane protein